MTARSERRRRRTLVGALIGLSLIAAGAGLAVVGANAIVNSTGGETVEADDRPVVSLPVTDNAALAVVDDEGRLTSLVVVTLSPSGQGGTIVTVPVTADANSGASEPRVALSSLLDPEDPAEFFARVEGTLAITLQFGEIVGADRLGQLLEPTLPADIDIPLEVRDSEETADGLVVAAGEVRLGLPLLAPVLQAVDVDATERQQHAIDVAVWSGVAASAPVVADRASVPIDDQGRPLSAVDIDELFARLWSGPVQVQDLALDPNVSDGSMPALDAEAVVLDRRDSVLVFAQISPARVSTPNPGPVFRLEMPISDAQLEASGSGYSTRQELGRNVVGQLLFLASNVVSVDVGPSPDGASAATRIEVADPDFVEAMSELGLVMFGDFEVVVADQLIDGVDAVVRLGTGYLESQPAPTGQADQPADDEADGESDAPTTDGAGTVVDNG